jgi:hypothetical protein
MDSLPFKLNFAGKTFVKLGRYQLKLEFNKSPLMNPAPVASAKSLSIL